MVLKLRYMSDLHLEFLTLNQTKILISTICPQIDEICILAGDIGSPYSENYQFFMSSINHTFKKTFVIAGNHEYYNQSNKTISETKYFMNQYFSNNHNNIRFLDNEYEYYENYCFIGLTLWSFIKNPRYQINDTQSIPNLDICQYNALHQECLNHLETMIHNHSNCIVITHHLPSYSLIDPKYLIGCMIPYNQWFACNLDDFICTNCHKIICWIYGHTHMESAKKIANIPFLCNPFGYPEENKNINYHATIQL